LDQPAAFLANLSKSDVTSDVGSMNFRSEGWMSSKPNAISPFWAVLALTCVLSVKAAVADEPPACLPTEGLPICTCDLTKLRPLQGAVGMKQVIYMENRIADDPKYARRRLEEDPIKVIAGVGSQLFILDHHHTAEAWLRTKTEWGANAPCKIVNSEKGLPPEFKTEDEFWAALKAARLVRLKNESGVDVDASQLPKTLEAMADDPFRSLAWFARQKGGFCKNSREFAEFAWADWFRSKSPMLGIQNLPSDPNDKNATVDEAVELAHSSEAENLPGYSAVNCQ
jgi:hypothetical protein